MSNFEFTCLSIPDLILVKPRVFRDERGFFLETYKKDDFEKAGIVEPFLQDNYSRSSRDVLRGLHYQKGPFAQGKLVRCVQGRIFDVAVDIRRGSPFYGQWAGAELTGDNQLCLYVPPGFAHGFVVLSDSAEVFYKCTCGYSPAHDRGIAWNDPDIGVEWPVISPVLSPRDAGHPQLRGADNDFVYQHAG
jgi:dTDP-4-dehydrorhamnose 3,5-epimerase